MSAVCDCGISWLYSLFDGNDFVIEQWEGVGDNFKFKWLCYVIICPIQNIEADFPWKVSLKSWKLSTMGIQGNIETTKKI